MKKHFVILSCLISSLACAKHTIEQRIEKLVAPYQSAIDFITDIKTQTVNDHDVFMFFNKFGLYEKKDVRKFTSTVRIVKRLAYSNKGVVQLKAKFEELLHNLYKIQSFIANYSATYSALITYYEICAYYYYIDEQNPLIVEALMQQTEQLSLPCMQHRGLYKLHKKISLDLRRLTALFNQNVISDDLVIKINHSKAKLLMLKNKIETSYQYKSQLRKTRLLKAFGVIVVPLLIATPFIYAPAISSTIAAYGISYASTYTLVSFGITMHELNEASKYNIPVHSTSLFSWFVPVFWPLTWVSRS